MSRIVKARLFLFIACLLLLLFPGRRLLQASSWEIFPSIHTVNQLIRIGNDLWGASNSGLLRLNLDDMSFQVFTTADGLSSNQINAMTADDRGNLILGMDNVYIDIFNLSTHEVTRLSDFKLNSKIFNFYALYAHDGYVYVGTDVGVSRLEYFDDLGKYLIDGNYQNLGDFNAETAAKAITVYMNGLWVGTESGLARGDLTQPFLESPENWINFTVADGLSSNDIDALEVYRDTLYVAAGGVDYALNRFLNLEDGFETLPIGATKDITFLKAHQDTLYYGRSTGLYRLVGTSSQRFGEAGAVAVTVEFDDEGIPWVGSRSKNVYEEGYPITKLGGLKTWDGETWVRVAPNGPLVETVNDILVAPDGSVWVSGRMELGFGNGSLCRFDGERWINLGRWLESNDPLQSVSPDSFFWFWTRKMTLDQGGGVWVGSDGRGAGWFAFTGDTIEAKGYFDANTGYLFNIDYPAAHYCVVRDLTTDAEGNIWICNSEAAPANSGDRPIAVVPADFVRDPETYPNWNYLPVKTESGTNLPYSEFYVDRIEIDSYGRIWFGGNNNTGEDKGVWILDDNNTPATADDDQWYHVLGLPSDSITAITLDRDGVMWVGTPLGVQYFYPEDDPSRYDGNGIDLWNFPIGQGVNVIAVDPQNNKWFGTTTGIAVLSSDNYTWLEAYTDVDGQYPSPLPGNVVQAIAFDPNTGEAYIGTDKGLARLTTPYKQMGETVTNISIITDSNPFLIGDGMENRLYFDAAGLSETVEMKIFTAAGYLVRRLTKTEILLGWDGRNSRGELVGSGVYLLLAYDTDGNADVGKVAVVHR